MKNMFDEGVKSKPPLIVIIQQIPSLAQVIHLKTDFCAFPNHIHREK